jgi:hypothetical protein
MGEHRASFANALRSPDRFVWLKLEYGNIPDETYSCIVEFQSHLCEVVSSYPRANDIR